MTLSPKARFQKTPDAAKHLELVVSDSFLNAVTAALTQMTMNLPSSGNPAQSWNNACMIEGANRFIKTLLNLAEPEPEQKSFPKKNLDPNV